MVLFFPWKGKFRIKKREKWYDLSLYVFLLYLQSWYCSYFFVLCFFLFFLFFFFWFVFLLFFLPIMYLFAFLIFFYYFPFLFPFVGPPSYGGFNKITVLCLPVRKFGIFLRNGSLAFIFGTMVGNWNI